MPMLSNSPNHFLASLSTTDGDLLRPHLKSLTLAQGAFVYNAAREFAAKVMRGLLRNQDEDWRGWTMEVRAGRALGVASSVRCDTTLDPSLS
jgi:hypothetical protein